jgi:hypothetical protein
MFRTQLVRGVSPYIVRGGISPYALWLTKSKGQHAGVKTIQERAKLVAAAYRALSPSDKAALFAEAKAMPTPARKEKKVKATRAPTAYNNFVKANFDSVMGLPRTERLKVIGVKWAAHKAAQ